MSKRACAYAGVICVLMALVPVCVGTYYLPHVFEWGPVWLMDMLFACNVVEWIGCGLYFWIRATCPEDAEPFKGVGHFMVSSGKDVAPAITLLVVLTVIVA